LVRLVEELACQRAGFLMPQPVLIAALFPLAEVLLGNRPAAELLRDKLLHNPQAVEPLDDFLSLLAILQTLVEQVAGAMRQPRDFAGAGHCFSDTSPGCSGCNKCPWM